MTMKTLRRTRFVVGVLTLSLCGIAAAEEATDEPSENRKPVIHGTLEVTADTIPIPALTLMEKEEIRAIAPVGDGSEVLRDVTGADLSRMGGHGLEPFIRGQSQGNLTVLLDGATVHGGCPNRMDPATSYAAAETSDHVMVIRGVQTVRYGPGAPGGTVLFDRQPPIFSNTTWKADLAGGGSNWSASPDLSLDASVGFGEWSLRALGSFRDTDNYQDGDGVDVRSAARSTSGTLMGGWRPDDTTTVELSFERSNTVDALFAGAGMDAPESTADIVRFQTERLSEDGRFGWRVDAFADRVDHLMDNYSLRPLTAPMAMRVPSETSTWGLRGYLELGVDHPILIGVTVESANADATRFAGPSPDNVSMLQSILWADVTNTTTGAFVEGTSALGADTRIVYGARIDYFSAEAARADEPTMGGNGPSPHQLWLTYTGNGDDTWSATELGGLVRVEHRRGRWQLFGGLSRTARVADATERYLGANSQMPTRRWVGNPGLEPALNHQIDLGAGWQGGSTRVSFTLFGADVEDFILRDRAHGQPGILQADNATVYRNVSARRYGVESDAYIAISGPLVLSASLAWVWAENTTDNRPVAQTPPLNGTVGLAWGRARWSLDGVVRWAAEQTRVDDDPTVGSGLDAGPTPGWAVLDLTGNVELGAGFGVQLGVANAFDRTYATHLNRASLFDPDAVRVNEPGRTYWLRLRWRGEG
jgi:iron complex outermembrane receptor protein